ncbi:MAG TPA: hypothetical protein VM451_01555, partial [Candidatus Limnocylindria bacterium]|nr:hypothetical protein [Candidatus Limnocylindria bacterium]
MNGIRAGVRSLAASALAILLAASVGGTVLADTTFIPKAVTFKADDAAKTITVTAKIAFYNRSCTPGTSCTVPPGDVSRIVQAIEAMWNNGSKVRCYTLIVKVEARSVGSQAEAGQNEVDVGLDYGPVRIRAFVNGQHHGAGATGPLGNTEDDRVEPAHNPSAPTTWPSDTKPAAWAHEFGHIMGLDDNYDPATSAPVSGTSEDLMFWNYGVVTGEMATRAVQRSGQIDVNKLKCGYATEGTQEKKWLGKHCDMTDPEWLINAEVSAAGLRTTELYTMVIDPTTHKGTYSYESIGELAGATYTQNGKGVASTVDGPDGTLIMNLSEIIVTGVIH